MRAVGYPRVSTLAQESSGFSLDEQVQSIEKFCAQNDIELVAHFMEQKSAATIKDRPAFKAAMLFALKNPDVDALVVTNLDRFSRSVLDSELIRLAFEKKGKKFISVQEQYLTPFREQEFEDEYIEAALQHRMVEAEAERKRINRRLGRGRRSKVQGGGWIGYRPPYEYDVIQGELILNPERNKIVRLIIRLRNIGMSFAKIAAYLNGKNRYGLVYPPPHTRAPLRKRNKPPIYGKGIWNLRTIQKFYIRRLTGAWGSGSEKQGILKAV